MDPSPSQRANRALPNAVPPASQAAEEALASVVHGAEDDYVVFAQEMEEAILREISELSAVPGLVIQFKQVCSEHARGVRDLLRVGVQVDDLDQFATGGSKLARECAHWDVSVASVLRICQLGAELTWNWWTERIEHAVGDPDLRAEVSLLCGRLVISYMNAGAKLIVEAHTEERERGLRGVPWQQRELVTKVLMGQSDRSPQDLTKRLGYELEAWHVAFVVWPADEHEGDLLELEASAKAWARKSGAQASLMIPGDAQTIWGWLGTAGQPPDDSLPDATCDRALVAVGQPGFGTSGFCGSHTEARQAQDVARQLTTDETVFHHRRLATLALLSDDVGRLHSYVARQLGGLAEATERGNRLRETVRVYLEHGESARAAADAMRFHRNSIHGRLELARELRGRPLEEDRLGLAVALEIARFRGAEVLAGPD